jgi:hypothetical protein
LSWLYTVIDAGPDYNIRAARLFAEDLTNHGKPKRNNDALLFF